jgi:hypothetical protein
MLGQHSFHQEAKQVNPTAVLRRVVEPKQDAVVEETFAIVQSAPAIGVLAACGRCPLRRRACVCGYADSWGAVGIVTVAPLLDVDVGVARSVKEILE